MADVGGSGSNDFIHVAGDGNTVPPGYIDIPLATDDSDYIEGRGGNDLVFAGGGADDVRGDVGNYTPGGDDELRGGLGDDFLHGFTGNDLLFGEAGDDLLSGGAGADTLDGGAGIDRVSYGGFAAVTVSLSTHMVSGGDAEGDVLLNIEEVVGTQFNDVLSAAAEGSRLDGWIGDDTLSGGSGDDVLIGGDGDDLVFPGEGQDFIIGGAGIDTADFGLLTSGVSEVLDNGDGSSGGPGGDFLFGVENLSGTNAGDGLFGNDQDNVLSGRDGGDWLSGNAGEDSLSGEGDNDRLYGDDGDDTLNGGDGDDFLDGGDGADHLAGGAGIDTLDYAGASSMTVNLTTLTVSGGEGTGDVISADIENINGSSMGDTLTGSAVANVLDGNDGSDTLAGRAGDDVLVGDFGDDVLRGGAGADRLDGGAGTDLASYFDSHTGVAINLATKSATGGDAAGDTFVSVENLSGSQGSDALVGDDRANLLQGWNGNDVLTGADGDDTLNGGDGDDLLHGGDGEDHLSGGAGIDTIDYAGTAVVWANLTTLIVSGFDRISADIENINGSSSDDMLTGSAVTNVLDGNEGSDTLDGLAGDDTLFGDLGDDVLLGGAGADRLDGGSGIDLASYVDSNIGVAIDLATNSATGGDAAGDTFTAVENLSGSQGNDTLVGDDGANLLQGWNGNDEITGAGGNDTVEGGDGNDGLSGGAGADVLRGGAGGDQLDGGDGSDTANYWYSSVGVTVDLATGIGHGGDAEGDTLTGFENLFGSYRNDTLVGDDGANLLQSWNGNDEITGAGGNDTLEGGDGSDGLSGGAGADVLRGGAGGDQLDGGDGSDTASYWYSAVGVTVDLATGIGHGGDAEGDTLAGFEILSGTQGDDHLSGDALANTLQGWNGNDVLAGGAGKDVLAGGAGADRFVLTTIGDSLTGANADRITDFSRAQGDKIDLSAIDADTGVAGDQAFTYIGTGLYTHQAGQLRYASDGAVTTIAGDVDGDGVSDFHIQLTGAIGLLAGDFVL
ncbi:MAG: calcium-binding protein [Inquilinus sp.]|uniref:calcium-binding protein n=1 Tax=Inquilinus sp. TaxID=1932117 RepID=UPI003F2C3B9F